MKQAFGVFLIVIAVMLLIPVAYALCYTASTLGGHLTFLGIIGGPVLGAGVASICDL